VLAILITIMVLELRPPEGTSLNDLVPLWPKFLSYALSFISLGIYWVNHHHLFQAVRTVNGRALWANMLLLFSLSLFPFATAWMGEHFFSPTTVAVYGVILFLPPLAYRALLAALMAAPGQPATLAVAIGDDRKGTISIAIYAIAFLIALVAPLVAVLIYFAVAAWWIVPDRRIERALEARISER
jgi:uncharacterized membrane protein